MNGQPELYKTLEELNIPFEYYEHPAVPTIEEAKKYWNDLVATHCKNIFFRNHKGNRHYLVILEESKRADLKSLTRHLGGDRLSFASPQRLERILGLEPGAVSPFGLINDSGREVRVLIDQDLRGASMIYFHPNVNTATVGLSFDDFERFLQHCGQDIRYFPV